MAVRLIVSLLFIAAQVGWSQEIAITFDDAPMPDSRLLTNAERTKKIISHLEKHHVQAAFFVITSNIDELKTNSLQAYTARGHFLANHSHSHLSAGRVSAKTYSQDFLIADSVLAAFQNVQPWFRYPYLNEGTSIPTRDSIRSALDQLHLRNGYVTVDNYDWFINGQLQQALRSEKNVDYEILKSVYLDHIYQSILFYDGIAQRTIGRSPRHVLLLHENDLAALYLDDLITLLIKRGWKIISPELAYQDKIASVVPDVLFNGQGRVGAIAYASGVPSKELVQESEDESYLFKLLDEKKVFR